MAGIYIERMSMPHEDELIVITSDGIALLIDKEFTMLERSKVIPVPAHGRTIDADALLKKMENDIPVYVGFTSRRQGPYAFRRDTEVYTSICGAPTVIPADKEE